MTDAISSTFTSITTTFASSTLTPSSETSLTSILQTISPTTTLLTSLNPSASPSIWSSPTPTAIPSKPWDSSTLIKVLVPVGAVLAISILLTWYFFQYRGIKKALDRRREAAGLPLDEQFPASVYPVPLPRPKTPPTPPVAPAYQPPVSGDGLELPPPGYNVRG